MKRLAILLALAGCTDRYDQAKNAYPAGCSVEDTANALVFWPVTERVPRADMVVVADAAKISLGGGTLNGLFIPATDGKPPRIMVADDLEGWLLEDTIRHERCHYLRGTWHD